MHRVHEERFICDWENLEFTSSAYDGKTHSKMRLEEDSSSKLAACIDVSPFSSKFFCSLFKIKVKTWEKLWTCSKIFILALQSHILSDSLCGDSLLKIPQVHPADKIKSQWPMNNYTVSSNILFSLLAFAFPKSTRTPQFSSFKIPLLPDPVASQYTQSHPPVGPSFIYGV